MLGWTEDGVEIQITDQANTTRGKFFFEKFSTGSICNTAICKTNSEL